MHAATSLGASRHSTAPPQPCRCHFGISIDSISNSRPPGACRLFHHPSENARFGPEPRQHCAIEPELTIGAPPFNATSPSLAHCLALRIHPVASNGLPAL